VLGVSSVAQLEEALGAVDLELAPELRAKLDAA
jgi:aryl-alcohol dehydrogenase-like predicted oxidoreductase